jgi:hypothetical protein
MMAEELQLAGLVRGEELLKHQLTGALSLRKIQQ